MFGVVDPDQRVRVPGLRQVLPGEGDQHARIHALGGGGSSRFFEFANVEVLLFAGQLRDYRFFAGRYQVRAKSCV